MSFYPNGCNHFTWFCQKVLPLVYDESLSYYEVLCKLTDFVKDLAQGHSSLEELVNKMNVTLTQLAEEFPAYKEAVNAMLESYAQDYIKYRTELNQANQAFQTQLQTNNAAWQASQNQARIQYEQNLTDGWEQWRRNMEQLGLTFRTNLQKEMAEFKEEVEQELNGMLQTLEDIKQGKYVDLYLDSIKAYIDQNLQQMVANLVTYVSFGLDNKGRFVAYIPPTWQFLHFGTIKDPESQLYGHLTLAW